MEEREIVLLYWERDPEALTASRNKYGAMLDRLSMRLLESREDAEECVSDTYLAAWNAMPTDRPDYLGAYLSKIARRISIDRFRREHAKKRQGLTACIDELAECLPDEGELFDRLEQKRLCTVLNRFLASISEEKRRLFLLRYFYGKSVREIAEQMGMGESRVKTALHRVRLALKDELEREELI